MAEDTMEVREIRLTDEHGNVAAVLRADAMKTDQPGAVFKILDNAGRIRARLVMWETDPSEHEGTTKLVLLDVEQDQVWDSREPTLAG